VRVRVPGAEGVEEPRGRHGDSRLRSEEADEVLAGGLAVPVDVEGCGRDVLAEGAALARIDGRGGREDEHARRPLAARPKEHARASEVHVERLRGVGVAVGDEVEGGEVEHRFRTVLAQEGRERRAVAHVAAHEPEPRVRGREELLAAVGQVVVREDVPALLEEAPAQHGADEARAPRHQRRAVAHLWPPPFARSARAER
jgi:hypothetical protein